MYLSMHLFNNVLFYYLFMICWKKYWSRAWNAFYYYMIHFSHSIFFVFLSVCRINFYTFCVWKHAILSTVIVRYLFTWLSAVCSVRTEASLTSPKCTCTLWVLRGLFYNTHKELHVLYMQCKYSTYTTLNWEIDSNC